MGVSTAPSQEEFHCLAIVPMSSAKYLGCCWVTLGRKICSYCVSLTGLCLIISGFR